MFLPQEENLVEEVEDSPDFWSGPVQSYNSPVEHRFLIGLRPNSYKILWLYVTFYNVKGLVKSMVWYVRVWAKALILIAAYHVTPGTC